MITYVHGDATLPTGEGTKIIAHITNDIGAWGKGFVVPLGQRYPSAKLNYKNNKWAQKLGVVQFVEIAPDIIVANMCAQHGIRSENGVIPLRMQPLARCLMIVSNKAEYMNASIHMPKIGSGLAGGNWEEIEQLINNCIQHVPVTVYTLQKGEM